MTEAEKPHSHKTRLRSLSLKDETETEELWSHVMRPVKRLKNLVSIDETDTETNDTQSQSSRPRLKRGLIEKIESITKTISKYEEEKWSD